MGCDKIFLWFSALDNWTQKDAGRIKGIWEYCAEHKTDGLRTLRNFFIAGATMCTPIVVKFYGYPVELSGHARSYVDFVIENRHIKDWMSEALRGRWVIPGNEVVHLNSKEIKL